MGHRHDGMYRSAMPGRGRSTCGAVKSTVRQAIPTLCFVQSSHNSHTSAKHRLTACLFIHYWGKQHPPICNTHDSRCIYPLYLAEQIRTQPSASYVAIDAGCNMAGSADSLQLISSTLCVYGSVPFISPCALCVMHSPD